MVINLVTHYIPETVVPNMYFSANHGISNEEIISKSGIKQRRRIGPNENTNSMAIEAVKRSENNLPYPISDIDLIIGGTYTPFDTIGTMAHAVQKEFDIQKAKCFTIDSACSSFVNAIEIVFGYFATKKASKALIVISENNSAYNDETDKKSNFLWGDGAAAIFISNERFSNEDIEVIDVNTTGLGHIGKSTEAICLRPNNGGLRMPFGRDVFQFACIYMIQEIEDILIKNEISINELSYVIPHQANYRIMNYVGKQLNLDPSRMLTNIEQYGNTGSASTPIVLSQNWKKFEKDDTIVISVFGGGYSSGAILLKKL
jgi:3-oxoacyl-[acyl-carrier-protein] synthase-3